MKPADYSQQSNDYQRIEKAIGYLARNFRSQPNLDEMAASVHLSKYHFNRVFSRWAGISPTRFLQYLTLEFTKQRLADAGTLLDVSLDAGLSGPSRLHDLFVTFEAVTPGEFKQMGAGLEIRYGFCPSPFGLCLLGITRRGINHLGFVSNDDRGAALDQLKRAWPYAQLVDAPNQLAPITGQIFDPQRMGDHRPFHLLLKGTNFQVNVWRALLAIPMGKIVSYQDIAAYIGRPKAFRAVANAIAINPVGYLIPCHRVIAKSGRIHQYRWGSPRKHAMVGREAAVTS